MKRWAVLTVVMYGVILLLLAAPTFCALGMKWRAAQEPVPVGLHPPARDASVPGPTTYLTGEPAHWEAEVSWEQALLFYYGWELWIVVAVLVAAQALLLLVPIGIAERRPVTRRKLLLPVALGSLLLTLLLVAGFLSLSAAAFKDKGFDWMDDLAKESAKTPLFADALESMGISPGSDLFQTAYFLGAVVLFWLLWTLVFLRFAKRDAPEDLVRRMTRWLLRGSILELLVAVPSHVIVRRRDDCCAPAATSAGILTGMSVMLLAFGPGVYFLFVERMRRLRGDRLAPPPPENP